MGLAASQARFLGITARKSNIEYEGQQVNQQRTVLAQEVSDLYNKLMQLDKPIQPVQSEFYETNYTFNIDLATSNDYAGSYKVNSYVKQSDGTYRLGVTRSYQGTKYEAQLKNNILNYIEKTEDGQYKFVPQGGTAVTLTKLDENESKELAKGIMKDCGNLVEENTQFYSISNSNPPQYLTADFVENYVDADPKPTLYIFDYLSDQTIEEDMILYASNVELDSYGNISAFNNIYVNDPKEPISQTTDVDVSKALNEEKMEEAMRNYTLQVDEYNRDYAKLNAETEDLQQQDKVLELRLDQIDTEEQELSTELEAVKKVIEKNIENTFKTFA